MALSPDEERQIAAAATRSGVDPSVLAAVVAEGGTLTAAQRDRVRRDKGLDARESRENEIDAMAIELARAAKKAPTPELAVAAFRADSDDPAAWDRPTRAFARRVSRRTGAGMQMQAPAGQRTGAGSSVAPAPVAPVAAQVAPQEAIADTPAPVEAAPPAGEREPMQGRSYGQAPEDAPVADPKWVKAYLEGTMSPADRAEFQSDLSAGAIRLPDGVVPRKAPAPAPAMGIMDTLADAVTGDSRKTATTEATTDLTLSPQMMQLRGQALAGPGPAPFNPNASMGERLKEGLVSGLKSAVMAPLEATGIAPMVRAVGVESAPQREQMAMVAAQNPNLRVTRDEKGNQSFIDPATGQRFGEDPGLGVADIPRAVATIGPGLLPGGAGVTAGRAIAGAAGLQAAQEVAQADMGGEFNTSDVLMAGAGEAIAPAARALRGGARAADEAGEATARLAGDARPPLVESQQLGKEIRDAAAGDAGAMARVATLAAVDKEAAKAAADLGLDLPLNVLADGPQIREAADAVISKMAGPERAMFKESELALAKKADEVLSSFDAAFADGRVAPGEVSARVAASMKTARDDVAAQAKALYREVDEVVPNESIAKMDAVRMQIMKRAEQVGNEGLSAPERAILEKIKEGDTPLGLIRQEKNLIGQAVGRMDAASPYSSMEKGAMKALYSALAADEAANVARIGGEAAARTLKKAHGLTKVQKGMEERVIAAFGKLQDGDITPLMRRALTNAVSDDNKALRQLMKIVPQEQRREVLATAIAGLGRDSGGRFSAQRFADAYPGLWKNKVARDLIRENLGPEADKMLGALASVSKRVAYANKRTPKTGESLQELARMDSQSLLSKVMASGIGRFAAVGTVGQIPVVGAPLAVLMATAPSKAKGATLEAMSTLLRDDAFAKLAVDIQTGAAKPADIKRMARNPRLRAFLRAVKEPHDPSSVEKWLTSAARGATMGGDRDTVKEPKL